jgi:hypothetical protein
MYPFALCVNDNQSDVKSSYVIQTLRSMRFRQSEANFTQTKTHSRRD